MRFIIARFFAYESDFGDDIHRRIKIWLMKQKCRRADNIRRCWRVMAESAFIEVARHMFKIAACIAHILYDMHQHAHAMRIWHPAPARLTRRRRDIIVAAWHIFRAALLQRQNIICPRQQAAHDNSRITPKSSIC